MAVLPLTTAGKQKKIFIAQVRERDPNPSIERSKTGGATAFHVAELQTFQLLLSYEVLRSDAADTPGSEPGESVHGS